MNISKKRTAILEALADGALSTQQLKDTLEANGNGQAFSFARQMVGGEVESRMVEIDDVATPQFVLRSQGFDQPEAPT